MLPAFDNGGSLSDGGSDICHSAAELLGSPGSTQPLPRVSSPCEGFVLIVGAYS